MSGDACRQRTTRASISRTGGCVTRTADRLESLATSFDARVTGTREMFDWINAEWHQRKGPTGTVHVPVADFLRLSELRAEDDWLRLAQTWGAAQIPPIRIEHGLNASRAEVVLTLCD